jgi:hypothetical protein
MDRSRRGSCARRSGACFSPTDLPFIKCTRTGSPSPPASCPAGPPGEPRPPSPLVVRGRPSTAPTLAWRWQNAADVVAEGAFSVAPTHPGGNYAAVLVDVLIQIGPAASYTLALTHQ